MLFPSALPTLIHIPETRVFPTDQCCLLKRPGGQQRLELRLATSDVQSAECTSQYIFAWQRGHKQHTRQRHARKAGLDAGGPIPTPHELRPGAHRKLLRAVVSRVRYELIRLCSSGKERMKLLTSYATTTLGWTTSLSEPLLRCCVLLVDKLLTAFCAHKSYSCLRSALNSCSFFKQPPVTCRSTVYSLATYMLSFQQKHHSKGRHGKTSWEM